MIEIGVGDRRRLLVVADDVASAEALRAHLSRHGFSVARASSARAAARAARELAPEVVLIDAAIHGGWRDVVLALDGLVDRRRVAVLAAYWSADAQLAARRFGIGETLLKQLEGAALVSRLQRLADSTGAADAGPESRRSPSAGVGPPGAGHEPAAAAAPEATGGVAPEGARAGSGSAGRARSASPSGPGETRRQSSHRPT